MKKLLTILLSLTLILSLVACGNNSSTDQASTVTETTPEVEEKAPAAEPVAVGNIITLPFAEMTVNEAAVADDIKVSIKSGSITYTTGPSSSPDKEFVYVRGTVKNTSKSPLNVSEFYGNVEVDGYTYEITTGSFLNSDGSSTYTLEPLIEYQYSVYAEVPNQLIEAHENFTLTFGFEENFAYMSSLNDNAVPAYNYTINITK